MDSLHVLSNVMALVRSRVPRLSCLPVSEIVDVEHPAQRAAVESAGGFSWLELSGSSLSNDVEWRVKCRVET